MNHLEGGREYQREKKMKFSDDKWEWFSNKDEPQRMPKGLFEMKDIHSTPTE